MENISKKNKNAKKNRKPQKPQKNLQKYAQKTAETTICKHETKHTPNRIHNNRLKTSKYRV